MKKLLALLALSSGLVSAASPTPRQFFDWFMTNPKAAGLSYYKETSDFCNTYKNDMPMMIRSISGLKFWDVLQYTRAGVSPIITKSELEQAVRQFNDMSWDGASWKYFRILHVDGFPNYGFYVRVSDYDDSDDLTSICVAVISYR